MLIEFDNVAHIYDTGKAALRPLSLQLNDRRIGIIGANGSGKSTVARMLNGLVLPSHGRVRVGGLDTAREGKQIRRRVGFCFTNPDAQIVMPTVAEDIAFGLSRRGLDPYEVTARVNRVLGRYGLEEHRDHPAHLLSGGQKQLLALAAVLVMEPDLLVLDEPTTLLDLRNARMVADVVKALPQQVVLVTHQLDLVADFDRVLVFDLGGLAFDGDPAAAVARYRELMR